MNIREDRIYYAQNREDLILESFFGDTKKGFYVDVGACHPHVASVTKRFYLKGWHGINIEPQKELCALFDDERPRDINLNIGVSDEETTIMLRAYIKDRGRSTTAQEIKTDYEDEKGETTDEYEDIPTAAKTLKTIFTDQKVSSIQFLKVDVEGFEYEVLKGNDWSKFRPEVICIEADHIVKDWRPMLIKNNYEKVFFDGLNEYYADSKTNRAQQFNLINHILLDLKGGISADDYDVVKELQDELDDTSSELQSLKKLLKRAAHLAPARAKGILMKAKTKSAKD